MASIFQAGNMDIKSWNLEKNNQLRDSVLNTTTNLESDAKKLVDELSNIHAAFLFIEESGKRAVKSICLLLTSTSDSIIHNGWRDFGSKLGLHHLQMECIQNGNYKIFGHCPDYTENILIAFAQHKDATVGRVLKSLMEIERFDIVGEVIKNLQELSQQIKLKLKKVEQIRNIRPDYISDNYVKLVAGIIVPPYGLTEQISQILPVTLSKHSTIEKLIPEKRAIENICVESIQQRSAIEDRREITTSQRDNGMYKYCKLVMLTFTADDLPTAKQITRVLQGIRVNNLPVGVLMLQNHRQSVLDNGELFINHLFPQMDYIIPVLTESYFKAISNRNPMSECLDERYVQYIYDLMSKDYIQNNCRNKKVRCVIPDNSVEAVHKIPKFLNSPILKAWFRESELDFCMRQHCR